MLRPAFPLALIFVAASAGAAPRPRHVGVRLEYRRGPRAQQCPGEVELRGWVAAGLGRDPFTEAGPWRLITSINRRRDGAFIAVTSLFDDKGAPASSLDPLVAWDCRDLVNALLGHADRWAPGRSAGTTATPTATASTAAPAGTAAPAWRCSALTGPIGGSVRARHGARVRRCAARRGRLVCRLEPLLAGRFVPL